MTGMAGWNRWSAARVYPNVPADTYAFDVRCATDFGTLSVNANTIVSNASVVELK